MLAVKQFSFNPFSENTYVVYHRSSRSAYVVDPGCYGEEEELELRNFLEEEKLDPKAILLTHAHIDHVLGLATLQANYRLSAYLHPDEKENFSALPSYAPIFGIQTYREGTIDKPLREGDRLPLGDTTLLVRKVPGHSPGHVVLYNEEDKLLFAGDTLFYEGIGRTDLPGGDHETLLQSIRKELYTLPDDTKVYPGHGPSTVIRHEKKNNPFVKQP